MQLISGIEAFNYLSKEFYTISQKYNFTPKIVALYIGQNYASEKYLNSKKKKLKKFNIDFQVIKVEYNNFNNIVSKIKKLNKSKKVHGIIIQLPLPQNISSYTQDLLDLIDPNKDIDCLTSLNLGKFLTGQSDFMPATPQGIISLIKFYNITLKGKNIVIINRSNLVGKPLALALLRENATVTLCHSYTPYQKLKKIISNSDIIISAIGKPKILKSHLFSPNQMLIDVGISYDENKNISGDFDFDNIYKNVKAITPVPGGVGPMTIYGLIKNIYYLIEKQNLSYYD